MSPRYSQLKRCPTGDDDDDADLHAVRGLRLPLVVRVRRRRLRCLVSVAKAVRVAKNKSQDDTGALIMKRPFLSSRVFLDCSLYTVKKWQ